MTSLSNQQKQLLFDYCIGLTSEQQSREAKALISSNKEAAEIHTKLKSALSPLDIVEFEPCPDELAERTILQLKELSTPAVAGASLSPRGRGGHDQLEQLLATEQRQEVTTKVGFWHNFSNIAAVAAVIVLSAGILIPSFSFARQRYWQGRCQRQLGTIFGGLSNYISDNDGQLPAVAATSGSPWWKVGYQGKENHSNTRPIWLLVKGNYVKPANFVCPGRRQGQPLQFKTLQVQNYNDFPSRKYITFSFRIRCDKSKRQGMHGRNVLIADLNPLFERLPQSYSKSLKLQLNEALLNLNSPNHNRRGQNVLFCDGSVKFTKTRYVGISEDDIFTLQEMCRGCEVKGCEVPSCETDAFVAP